MDIFEKTRDTRQMSIIAQLIVQLITMTKLLVLKPLKIDISQNIDKINIDNINNAKNKSIKELNDISTQQINDIINNSTKQNEGVVWLAFSFSFMAQFLNYLLDETVTVQDAAQRAYKDILEPHHNSIQKGIFKTGFMTLPSRQDFCQKTGLVITDELKQVFNDYKTTSDKICNEIVNMSQKKCLICSSKFRNKLCILSLFYVLFLFQISFITQTTKKKHSIFGKCMQDDSYSNAFTDDQDDYKYDIKQDLQLIQQTPETEQQLPDQDFINEIHKIKPTKPGRPLLVLDLDETLVHSSFQQVNNADFSLQIQVNDPQPQVFTIYVYKRPYLQEFLEKMSQYYDLCVFTASLAIYCDSVMDKVDPQHYVRYRLYRNHCSCVKNLYIKDLSLLDYPLQKILIIDNSQVSFAYHPDNGILCPDFYDDRKDRWLKDAIGPLIKASQQQDVRTIVSHFK